MCVCVFRSAWFGTLAKKKRVFAYWAICHAKRELWTSSLKINSKNTRHTAKCPKNIAQQSRRNGRIEVSPTSILWREGKIDWCARDRKIMRYLLLRKNKNVKFDDGKNSIWSDTVWESRNWISNLPHRQIRFRRKHRWYNFITGQKWAKSDSVCRIFNYPTFLNMYVYVIDRLVNSYWKLIRNCEYICIYSQYRFHM